jgi:amino acid adenylation domain-containing protein
VTRLLQDWVSAQAQRSPDSVAVVLRDQTLTYGELDQLSNRLARLLKSAGCQKGDRVAFAIPKSPTALVAVIGILKADCIHVPIDTASPAARVAKILQSSDPRCILAVEATSKLLNELIALRPDEQLPGVGWMDGLPKDHEGVTSIFNRADLESCSSAPLACQNSSADIAHILYTSGSTGDPKGVVITHANIIHFVEWATRYFRMDSSDRVSGHPPLHFDLATFDIFGAFSVGAQLHLVPPDLVPMPNEIADFIRVSRLTQWFSVPSVLHYMAKFDVVKFQDFPSLKRLLWCGEVFPTPALIYWMKRLPRVTFTNLYGPTEATIASSYHTIPICPAEDDAPIPIGTACDGEELLVLDEHLQPTPQGAVGDLYIRGVGLSPGYWRDPEKTARAFLPYGADGSDRIYKTGDLAHIGSDGLVYFMGRSDSQIKSRGHRIELGEVEAALNTLEELKECAVIAMPTEGFEGTLICSAYVPQDTEPTHSSVRSKLSRLLPSYMLPARWMRLEELPKNANGKIDRRQIRELFASQLADELPPLATAPHSRATSNAHH